MTDIHDLLREWANRYYGLDQTAVELSYAAYTTSYFKTVNPLWLLLVGGPSWGKSTVLAVFKGFRNSMFIDEFTTAGARENIIPLFDTETLDKVNSGLLQLKSKELRRLAVCLNPATGTYKQKRLLVIDDLSLLVEGSEDEASKVMSFLRTAYKGEYTIALAAGMINSRGRITLMAGVTPHIDSYQGVRQALGERFVMYRLSPPPFEPRDPVDDEKNIGELAKLSVQFYKDRFGGKNPVESGRVCARHKTLLIELARFISKARTFVPRDSRTRDVTSPPVTESPQRLYSQLTLLLKGVLANRGDRLCDSDEAFGVVVEAGLSSMLGARLGFLEYLDSNWGPQKTQPNFTGEQPMGYNYVDLGDVINFLNMTKKPVEEIAWDLEHLSLIERNVDDKFRLEASYRLIMQVRKQVIDLARRERLKQMKKQYGLTLDASAETALKMIDDAKSLEEFMMAVQDIHDLKQGGELK